MRGKRRRDQQVRAARLQAAAVRSRAPLDGLLRRKRLHPKTRDLYAACFKDFLLRARQLSVPVATAEQLDAALDRDFVQLFLQGKSVQDVRRLFYAAIAERELRPLELPLAHASLRGFTRDEPEPARDPCTWEAALLIADWILRLGGRVNVLMSAAVVVQFDTYARPGALLVLRREAILEPGMSRFAVQRQFLLEFFPTSGGVA